MPIRPLLLTPLMFHVHRVLTASPNRLGSGVKYSAKHTDQTLDVYGMRPSAGVGTREAPALVAIHGGGWIGGSSFFFGGMVLVHKLVARGWVVVVPEYKRGFCQWPSQLECCRDALSWTRQHAKRYGVDPGRLHVLGQSAGGHMAALLAIEEATAEGKGDAIKPPLKAILLYYPVLDIVLETGHGEGVRWWCGKGKALLRWYFECLVMQQAPRQGGGGESELTRWSPTHQLEAHLAETKGRNTTLPPILMVTCDSDSAVPPGPALRFASLLCSTTPDEGDERGHHAGRCGQSSLLVNSFEDGLAVQVFEVPGTEHGFDIATHATTHQVSDAVVAWLHTKTKNYEESELSNW
mmetsp:Transcript_6681/g.13245  ORF Transcript_6681/g.13245 Transcript_6681/m.13245 type:complete len:351 (-) Transcript_6681:213-1265(-)